MKSSIKYISFALLLLALASSCKRDELPKGEKLCFAPSVVPETKGFLEASGLDVVGTRVKVYDYLSDFEGTIVSGGTQTDILPGQTVKYIDDVVTYDGGTYWPYVGGNEYRWTKSGTHSFFGWLDFDKACGASGTSTSGFFGSAPSFDESTRILTTPTYTFQALESVPQYDFVFAKQVIKRDAASGDYSYIALQCKHLFTAISLTFENKSTSSNIEITGLSTLYEGTDLFLHKGWATIDFSSDSENITPEYHLETDASKPFFSASKMAGKIVAPDEKYDVFSGAKMSGTGAGVYYMTWPLTALQAAPQDVIGQDIFGDPIYDPRNAILELKFRVNGGAEESARVSFPFREWKAGTRVHLNIEFTDKSIQIVSETIPWDYNEHEMSFNSESITTPGDGKLKVNYPTPEGTKVYLTTENPVAQCELSISSLKGATLVIKKIGAYPAYFDIVPSEITITGGRLVFEVRPSALDTGGQERTIQLSFTVVLPNDREIEGDAELIDKDRNYIFSRR